ncbi:hypothetical protein [Nocardioides sp. SR21]|uniref:hypothetical protein n=1 Tax=Nocardioides sp. SR21 TaxID=2919501 RepID=UPI001FA9AF7B|nr:hypothetical protein [Nocardioides sp. SR21]
MIDETRLSDELSRRAHDVRGSTLTLDDVQGRARSIRRRRAAAVAGGVAAAVALVVLVPTVLSGGSGPKSDGVDPAPRPPGHTAVLHDGTLTLPGGGTVALDVDNADVTELGLLTDGRIVLASTQPHGVLVYGPGGELQAEYTAQNTIAMSPDDRAVAWLEDDGSVHVLESGVAEPTELGTVEIDPNTGASIDAVIDAGRVLVGNWNTTTTEVTAGGVSELTTSEPLHVTDVSPDGDLWAVQYADDADPQFGCQGLYDPAAATMVARNCETGPLRFSPDGQHLLGMRGDNNMYGDASVLDLDLQRVGGWASGGQGDVISSAAWADADHVLVSEVNWKTSTWTLVEVDLAWTEREVLDGPTEGRNPEMLSEYLLSE